MSIAGVAFSEAEKRLPKVISPRTHGIVDYCHAAFFFGVAWFCRRKEPRAAAAALAAASFLLVEALLTDYPLGAAKIIPFETHGKMDTAFAATSFMIPKMFGFSESPAAAIFRGNGFAESSVVAMTNYDSENARAQEHEPAVLAS